MEAKGYEYDMFMFREWAVVTHDQGLGAVLHARDQDYIGYHYILWLVAELYAPIAGNGWQDDYLFLHVLKVPGTIADLGVSRSALWRHEPTSSAATRSGFPWRGHQRHAETAGLRTRGGG